LLRNVRNGFAFKVMAMFAVNHYISLVVDETGQCFEQCGLSSAIWANHRYKFTRGNRKRRIQKRPCVAVGHCYVDSLKNTSSVGHEQRNAFAIR
jgi:hypothetical protein